MSSADQQPPYSDNLPESPPVRLLARLASLVWWLLLFLLVLLALYAGLGRQLTQNIDQFRDDLAMELSRQLGHEVSIGAISSRWYWLDPAFTATDMRVSHPETGIPVANLQYLNIRFDALASLLRMRIVFEDFEADGLELTINQERSGEVAVRGAEFPEPVSNQLQEWLELAGNWLSDPYVKITRVSLGIRDNQGNLRHLDIPQLDLDYRRGLFHASGRALQSGTTQQLASFALVGQHFFRGDFTGQIYLDVASGRLFDGLVDEYQWRSLRVEGFDLGGEAWLTFRGGQLQQVTGSVQTPYLQLGVGQQSLAPLEDIRAQATVLMGIANTAKDATENFPASPYVGMVAPPQDAQTLAGEPIKADDGDLTARILSSGNTHRALPLTGALCCATGARIEGTVIHRHTRPKPEDADIQIMQPSGIIPVACTVTKSAEGWIAEQAGVYRTQRRLFEGRVLIPGS